MIIKNKVAFVYDIEIFPNFFSCAMKNSESQVVKVFEISSRRNDLPEIPKIFLNRRIIFVSYNGIHYDNPIINYILINYDDLIKLPVWEINKKLKEFSDLIIKTGDGPISWKKYKYANLFYVLDLLTMQFAKKLRVGLKELQVTMEYKNVREYEGDFNAMAPEEDFDSIISYNINDILSTEELMNRLSEDIQLRIGIEKSLGIDVLNKDGVNLGVEVIKENYLKDTGKTWEEIKDLRSPCSIIPLKDILFNFIKFETPELKKLHKELLETTINLDFEKSAKKEDKFQKTVFLSDIEITYSLGGIHTKNKPQVFHSDDEWVIVDSDCALVIGAR